MKEKDTAGDCDVKNINNGVKPDKLECSENEHIEDKKGSNDDLVEIKVNECVKRSELTTLDIRSLVVRCTSCGCQINHSMKKSVLRHRKLGVITCRECYEFYGSSEFSQDESGYNYCTWCGNGGKLIVCDFCPNGFCNSCIRRNFGRSEISVTMKEGWKCYCCERIRLEPKINFCNVILGYDKVTAKKEKKPNLITEKRNRLSEKWLEDAFNDCDSSSKMFHKKLSKLKRIGVTKSKSLKHVIKKMEEVINTHKSELKKVFKQVAEQYDIFIESQRKVEEERIINKQSVQDATVTKDDVEKSAKIITNELDDEDIDCIIIGDDTPVKEPIAEVNETIQAKLSLLQSSSDNDSQDGTSSKPDPMMNSCENGNAKDTKAKRSLDFEVTDSKSGNESDKNQKVDMPENLNGLLEENDDSEQVLVSPEEDPKLKLQSRVDIFRCDTVFKIEDGSVLLSDGDDEAKLDKLIDSLCKSPIKKARKQCHRGNAGPKCKKVPVPAAPVVEDSSSSISLSSDDERGKTEIPKNKINDLQQSSLNAKAALMNSDSSVISFGSEGEEGEEEKKKKKTKTSRKKETDSSDDFVPKKKKKYDRLLHAPLLSDDEKRVKSTKERKLSKKRVLSSEEEGKEKKSKKDSTTDSTSEEEQRNQSKKKLKRIKKLANSSSDEDIDQENADGQAGKGRKNIKKIISQKKLATTTKEAQLEEKERKKRIEERQKLYNQVVDTSLDGKQVITKKMVLEMEEKTKKVVVEIHPDLVCKLKPHQVNGVKFMWECTIETVKDLGNPGSGCILAHCMGLGKTLQVITFLHTCLTNPLVGKTIRRAIVICPYNTALNWASEFEYWLHDVEWDIKVHQLAVAKSNFERLDILQYWFDEGGVLITSYDVFRRLGTATKIPKLKAKERKALIECLLDPGPDIVVCDEGHVLRNEASAVSKAVSKLRTRRRIVLTGTPLQNNLKEYHCMLSFVKPNLLGTVKEFRNRFVNPIINGQYDDSTEFDVKLMKKRIHILHKLLDGCVQRCDYSALTKFLPPKHEFVISIKLSEVQMKMYECYLELITLKKKDAKSAGSTLFIDFNNLRCIWNHPYMCIESHKKHEYKRMMADDDDDEEMADFIVDDSETAKSSSSSNSNDDEDTDEIVKEYKTRSRRNKDGSDVEEIVEAPEEMKQWFHEFISDEDKCNIQLAGKMVLLMDILRECEAIGDKIIVFSQSLLTLNAIEEILHHSETLPMSDQDKDRDVRGRWIKGLDYFRMDGGTNLGFRKSFIDMFNSPTNDRARLFLVSTKAGGLGTNLVGANRVIVFDTSWNPSHDVQAIFRVYRFGQIKPVYIYRFLAQGTMEEKIYDRQVTKLSLSCRVVDEQQIDRHFSAADLAELYTFDRNSTSNRPTPLVPKDRLLAEMLIKHKEWIVTYHEHDSLLQSQTEEDLTEEERQAAWTEYENEREGREPPPTFDDGMDFAREPDFTASDYEGKVIPDIQSIIVRIFEHLKAEMPGVVNTVEFKKKLLASVFKVRQVFQEKHVKILRMKQEHVARGTVPNAVNKYMEELSNALKSTGDYINRLKLAIGQEEAKLKQQWQENVKRMQDAGIRRNCDQEEWRKQIFNMMNNAHTFRGRMPQQVPPTFINRGQTFPRPSYTYSSQPKAKPVITEADENASETVSTSSKKPTIIEVDEEPAAQSNVTRATTVTIEEID